MKSTRKAIKTYLIGKKLFLNKINMREIKVARNSMPAAALISLSFKQGYYTLLHFLQTVLVYSFIYFLGKYKKTGM
jgi:hypothetical protein